MHFPARRTRARQSLDASSYIRQSFGGKFLDKRKTIRNFGKGGGGWKFQKTMLAKELSPEKLHSSCYPYGKNPFKQTGTYQSITGL